jgi:hypothetical protein
MMDDGRIVFGIYNNTHSLSLEKNYPYVLSIYNINGSYEDCIPLQNDSLGMTAIDNSTVAVTSYNTIDMYDINNKVKIKSIILSGINFDMHQLEWGDITTTNNNLVVSVGNGSIHTCHIHTAIL